MNYRDHFWGNLDKFMLAFFVVYFTIFAYGAVTGSANNPFTAAMLDNEKTVLGAFLGLVTGRAIQRAQDAPFMRPTSNPPGGAQPDATATGNK